MLYPEINQLRDAAGSRYYLVSMASKRARDIIDGSPKLDPDIMTEKPVSIAAEEIAEDLFTYVTIEDAEETENAEAAAATEENGEAVAAEASESEIEIENPTPEEE